MKDLTTDQLKQMLEDYRKVEEQLEENIEKYTDQLKHVMMYRYYVAEVNAVFTLRENSETGFLELNRTNDTQFFTGSEAKKIIKLSKEKTLVKNQKGEKQPIKIVNAENFVRDRLKNNRESLADWLRIISAVEEELTARETQTV